MMRRPVGVRGGRRAARAWITAAAVAVAVVGAVVAGAGCRRSSAAPPQPIAFNHTVHVRDEKIPCTDCHPGAERGVRAGLPGLPRCLACHMKPQGDPPKPREQAVRTLAASRAPVRWTQVTRNAGHVYFSHRPHVVLAKLTCTDCHGDVSAWAAPPTEPRAELLSMSACVDCHRDEGASTECDTCHQ